MRRHVSVSVGMVGILAVMFSWTAIAPGADPNPSKNELFSREAGTWDVTYKQWPQGTFLMIGEPTQHFKGVEVDSVSTDGLTLSKKHICHELLAAEPTLGGPEFQRQAFRWTTGDGLTFSYDAANRSYLGRWIEDEKKLGSMKGHYDQKTKTLMLTYVDPKTPQNGEIRHETRYIDEKTKRVTISILTPVTANSPLPTSWIIFEMEATKK
jgi:Protein of unknown function (DUF1579)